mmetsp:Transcript_32789/g.37299  ORF Transcript_32789/g.37299 Transcript_32789/m.37299 type:complete len:461 (-) Transcript_32789:134-1516(-)
MLLWKARKISNNDRFLISIRRMLMRRYCNQYQSSGSFGTTMLFLHEKNNINKNFPDNRACNNNFRTPHTNTVDALYDHNNNTLKNHHRSYSSERRRDKLQNLGIMKARIPIGEPRYFARRKKNISRANSINKILFPYPKPTLIPVKAIHASQTIHIVNVFSKVFGAMSIKNHKFYRNSLIVQLNNNTDPATNNAMDDSNNNNTAPKFVAIYRFGSIVFFNLSPREVRKLNEAIKKQGTGAISAGFERDESFQVAIEPNYLFVKGGREQMNMAATMDAHVVNGDFCVVPTLDFNSTAIISNIMAQSVALDSYSDIVDELLTNFANVNSSVTKTGNFTQIEKESLFRIVSQNNSVFIDMVSKIGVKDRSETAWNLSQYEQIHEGLREEFEIESRFKHIEFKLDLIQQNAKFFLEVLHSQKSNSLEWCILVLILFECVLMITEMSGLGESFFGGILQSILPPK